ncbi:hypothetical protein GCM10027404_20540 [Arthrobacter tumbae]|uniref:hypothetical protein n=1 Tax=Arthrobacter tumbae TaxID=163874 RepID=UPI001958F413|nr:hypothetical protein [Arthrobacter tumbae]MBM7781099.1 hypothetical protein [Arthrobacter tumbae]
MNEQNATIETVELRALIEGQHMWISPQLCHRPETTSAPRATSISMAAVLGSTLLSVVGAEHLHYHAADRSRSLSPVNGGP